MADDRQLRQALAYAHYEWQVFPVVPGGKIPATPHGFLDATTDESRIREWWQRNPGWNIGLATGHPGPDVVDVDRHSADRNGFAAWNAAKRAGLVERPLAIVATPSGGIHAYFRGSDQRSVATTAHVDFRSQGGYVVAPRSTVAGKPYVVVHRDPRSTARVDFGAVRQLVEPQQKRTPWSPPEQLRDGGRQNLDHLVQHMAELDDGRKRYLFWAANRILDHRQPERLADLAAAARAAGSEPRQIERTIESARRQLRQDPHVSVSRDGSRPDAAHGADCHHAAQAIHPSATAAECRSEQSRRRSSLEAGENGPGQQTAAESHERPGEAAGHHIERDPDPFPAADERPEHSHGASEPSHEACRVAAARPFEPEPDWEAGE
jgi:Bifunctional DNA primase/polymerase, N-terminal